MARCGFATSYQSTYPTLEFSPMGMMQTLGVENAYQRKRFVGMLMDSLKLFHGYVKTLPE